MGDFASTYQRRHRESNWARRFRILGKTYHFFWLIENLAFVQRGRRQNRLGIQAFYLRGNLQRMILQGISVFPSFLVYFFFFLNVM